MSMKKILLSLLALIAFAANAQNILIDKTEKDGYRYVCTDFEPCRNFSDKIFLLTGMSVFTDQDIHTSYSIEFKLNTAADPAEEFSINEGAKILIRTGDDTVLELTSNNSDKDDLGQIVTGGLYPFNSKTICFSANISNEDLVHLFSGILKFRCEINSIKAETGYFETSFKKAKNAKYFIECTKLLKEAISEKRSSSITEGF